MKFTDKYIYNLKPKDKMYQLREGDGFGIRILSSGVKIWIFTYTIAGRRRQMNLGSYPGITLANARARLLDVRKAFKDGQDPQEVGFVWHRNPEREKREAEEAAEQERKKPTVRKLADEYMTLHAKINKRETSWKEDERLLNKDVLPLWGERKACDIKKRDCVLLLEAFMDRPALCHNILKLTRKMFNFSVERDILKHTPFTGVKAPVQISHRERVLSEDEIRALWTTELPKASMSTEVKNILKIALLTGQRVGEICGITPQEIDGEWWTIPGQRTKNGVTHRVYLTKTVRSILGTPKGEYYFPSPKINNTNKNGIPANNHINKNAVSSAVRRNLKGYKGRRITEGEKLKMVKVREDRKMELDHFTPHDLRRTCATFLSGIGQSDEVIDALLNHKKTGVIKIYNHNNYAAEKQVALEAWECKLFSIINLNKDNI